GRRRRPPADAPVRPGHPRRDPPPRLPRGTPGRLPQPRPGHRAGPQTPGTAGSHRHGTVKIVAAAGAGRLSGAGKIGVRVGKVIGRYKMAKHYTLDITNDQFAFTRDQDQITAEAALDGPYVIRTTVAAEQMDPAQVVATYKSLSRVERDFASLKAIDVDLRPIHHYTQSRVRD